MSLPQPIAPMVDFAQSLRGAGFAIAPDQTVGFIEAVGLLGPGDILDLHKAGLALFSIPPERREEYDAIFRAVFMDQSIAAPATGDDDDEVEAHEPTGDATDVEVAQDDTPAGDQASLTERLGQRALAAVGEAEALQRFTREAPGRLPRRASYRRRAANTGDALDMRRILRDAARREGEVLRLYETTRKSRQRRVLLLVDVSGSMEGQTEASLRFAHALVQSADRAEVFTLGTRLTRVTAALGPADRVQALARASDLIADIDGGTRLGDALAAFLNVPRFAGFARGAAVVILSDGLERDGPEALVEATARLSRLAWRLDWLTPLAADPGYRPETAALSTILPMIDRLGDGSSTRAVADHVLTLARPI